MMKTKQLKLPGAFWAALVGLALALLVFGWQLEDMSQRMFELVLRTTEVERLIINQIKYDYPQIVDTKLDSVFINWDLMDTQTGRTEADNE